MKYKLMWRSLVRDIFVVLGVLLLDAVVVRGLHPPAVIRAVVYALLLLTAFTVAGCVGGRDRSTRYLDLSIVGAGYWSIGLLNLWLFPLDATFIMLTRSAALIGLSVLMGVYLSLLLRPPPPTPGAGAPGHGSR